MFLFVMSKDRRIGINTKQPRSHPFVVPFPTNKNHPDVSVFGTFFLPLLDLKIMSTLHPLFIFGEGENPPPGASPMHLGENHIYDFQAAAAAEVFVFGMPSWWSLVPGVFCALFGFQNTPQNTQNIQKKHQTSGGMTGSHEIDAKL